MDATRDILSKLNQTQKDEKYINLPVMLNYGLSLWGKIKHFQGGHTLKAAGGRTSTSIYDFGHRRGAVQPVMGRKQRNQEDIPSTILESPIQASCAHEPPRVLWNETLLRRSEVGTKVCF